MDPKEINNEVELIVSKLNSDESVLEKLVDSFEFNYDIFGCWESSQDDSILFI